MKLTEKRRNAGCRAWMGNAIFQARALAKESGVDAEKVLKRANWSEEAKLYFSSTDINYFTLPLSRGKNFAPYSINFCPPKRRAINLKTLFGNIRIAERITISDRICCKERFSLEGHTIILSSNHLSSLSSCTHLR
jgi:hypothetical protein